MVKVTVGIELLDKDTGDQGLRDLADDANRKGGTRYTDGVDTTFEVFQRLMKLDVAQYVVSKGGDVLDFHLHVEIASGEDLVPPGVFGSTYVAEEGEEAVRTWNEWLAPNSYIVERDGRKFVGTQCCVDYTKGSLPLSQLVPVFSQLIKELPEEVE